MAVLRSIPARARYFPPKPPDLLWDPQPVGTRAHSRGPNAQLDDVDYSPATSVEVKNDRSYTSTPSICLHGTERDSCTLCSDQN